jgi:hypothetical protein
VKEPRSCWPSGLNSRRPIDLMSTSEGADLVKHAAHAHGVRGLRLTPFAPQLSVPLRAWHIDQAKHCGSWDAGLGSYVAGGRWNLRRIRAVYCSLDPATAILELAVHTGFRALDATPHMITGPEIADPAQVHVLMPAG